MRRLGIWLQACSLSQSGTNQSARFSAPTRVYQNASPSMRQTRYLNIQFSDAAADVSVPPEPSGRITPILEATPTDAVRQGPYVHPRGPYPHIVADSGRRETLMWVFERRAGGRGFGLTGGHFHANWAIDAFRVAVLNALVWIAGVDVPAEGIVSALTSDDLDRNLDP